MTATSIATDAPDNLPPGRARAIPVAYPFRPAKMAPTQLGWGPFRLGPAVGSRPSRNVDKGARAAGQAGSADRPGAPVLPCPARGRAALSLVTRAVHSG